MKTKIKNIIEALGQGLYERANIIKLAFLAMLAGENIFLLGPPGVAKSLIARRMAQLFKSGKSFEYLMGKFSTPDEIFGPVSIEELKKGNYVRNTEHYLPWADVVFLDEIWKAGPAIQNALLTAINEKVYRNGAQEVNIRLKGLIAASNELPAKGEGLEALWDRFIIRSHVSNINDQQNFRAFLRDKTIKTNLQLKAADKIKEEEFKQWQVQINAVNLSDACINVIEKIRIYLTKYNQSEGVTPIYVSDRRWKKVVRILKAAAWSNGRKSTDLMDCFLIAACIWDEEEHIEVVRNFVQDAVSIHGIVATEHIESIKCSIQTLKKAIEKATTQIEIINYEAPKEFTIGSRNFYKIKHNRELKGAHKEYNLINVKEFETLQKSSLSTIDLYNSHGEQARYCNYKAALKNDNCLTIENQSDHYYGELPDFSSRAFKIFTTPKEKKQSVKIEASDSDKVALQQGYKAILKKINRQLKLIEQNKKGCKDNLFVDAVFYPFVEQNTKVAAQQYLQLKQDLLQLKNTY